MPTNHQPDGTEPVRAPVADLAAHRRERLQHLLRTRGRLATVVAERVAHDVHDTDDFIMELLGIEQTIQDQFPVAYEELAYTEWLFADMARMHTPDEPLLTCSICSALTSGAPLPDPPTTAPVTAVPQQRAA